MLVYSELKKGPLQFLKEKALTTHPKAVTQPQAKNLLQDVFAVVAV